MTQHDLNRAVASCTGESVGEISRRGFVPLTRGPIEHETESLETEPLDWDAFDQQRIGVLSQRRARPASPF